MRNRRKFAVFAWVVLLYNIPVILWGAFVRASFSGDGCGASWPFCSGRVLPQSMGRPMAIEFTHRMMTSLDLLFVGILVFWAFRAFPRANLVRQYASWSAIFLLIEALLGAGLVLFRLVAHDQSAGRAIYLSAHLTNTMLLLGALAITAWLASRTINNISWEHIPGLTLGALLITVAVSVTGALAALGDTLFPVGSLAAGMQQEFSSGSNAMLKLRLFHPAIAIAGAVYLLWAASRITKESSDGPARQSAVRVMILVVFQLVFGALNLSLLAPVWMQMLHLLVADIVWIAVIYMVLEASQLPVRSRHLVSLALSN